MRAILYESNAGHTAAYARLLSQRTGLPAWTLAQAAAALEPGDEILFMGWIMAGSIKGLKKARGRYRVEAVCAVGMTPPGAEALHKLREQNGLGDTPLFLLQGGLNLSKLHGMYRWMIRMLLSGLKKKPNQTREEQEMLRLAQTDTAVPSIEKLREVISFVEGS